MTFGETLYKLRKEKGLSQEALAEMLDTSRQAVSKWENDQGYPETEKLLMLSHIFEVSVDRLLKSADENERDEDKGYYVSLEMATGYLLAERKQANYLGYGFCLLAFAAIPYFLFQTTAAFLVPTLILAVLGVLSFVAAGFAEDKRYRLIPKRPLIFDPNTLKDLQARYALQKGKRRALAILCAVCLAVCAVLFMFLKKELLVLDEQMLSVLHAVCVFLMGVGLLFFVRLIAVVDSYTVLLENERHMHRTSARLGKRIRKIVYKE